MSPSPRAVAVAALVCVALLGAASARHPGEQIDPPADTSFASWQAWLASNTAARAATRKANNLNGSIFEQPAIEWAQTAYIQPQSHPYDQVRRCTAAAGHAMTGAAPVTAPCAAIVSATSGGTRSYLTRPCRSSVYDDATTTTTAAATITTLIPLPHIQYFYDIGTHSYTIGRYLKDLNTRYGGIDAVLGASCALTLRCQPPSRSRTSTNPLAHTPRHPTPTNQHQSGLRTPTSASTTATSTTSSGHCPAVSTASPASPSR